MPYEYRPIKDVGPFLDVAQFAFALPYRDRARLEEFVQARLADGDELFGVYQEDRLLSAFMLLGFRMRLRGSLVPMGGIAFVCSRPEVRGKGCVRFMLEQALLTMRDRGHVVSVLYPFSLAFYRKYGWELFTQELRVRFPPGLLQVGEEPGIEARALPFPDDDSQAFYNEYARSHYNLAQRGEAQWRKELWPRAEEAARGVVKFTRDGRVVGLLFYILVREEKDQVRLLVPLFAPGDGAAKRAMLRFLKGLSHQVGTVELQVPADFSLWPYLADSPSTRALHDAAMIRIVSLEALDGLELSAPEMSLGVLVEDRQAPWNDGTFAFSVEGGRLRVDKGKMAQLRLGIGALSSAISGFTNFQELIAAGRVEPLEGYRGQDLPKATTFLADHF